VLSGKFGIRGSPRLCSDAGNSSSTAFVATSLPS
jgi:hypothetical protein